MIHTRNAPEAYVSEILSTLHGKQLNEQSVPDKSVYFPWYKNNINTTYEIMNKDVPTVFVVFVFIC